MDYRIIVDEPVQENINEIDIFIEFIDGSKYVATFYTLDGLCRLMEYNINLQNSNWIVGSKDMIIVKEFESEIIKHVLSNVISLEPYWDIFTPCNSKAIYHNASKKGKLTDQDKESIEWLDGLDET